MKNSIFFAVLVALIGCAHTILPPAELTKRLNKADEVQLVYYEVPTVYLPAPPYTGDGLMGAARDPVAFALALLYSAYERSSPSYQAPPQPVFVPTHDLVIDRLASHLRGRIGRDISVYGPLDPMRQFVKLKLNDVKVKRSNFMDYAIQGHREDSSSVSPLLFLQIGASLTPWHGDLYRVGYGIKVDFYLPEQFQRAWYASCQSIPGDGKVGATLKAFLNDGNKLLNEHIRRAADDCVHQLVAELDSLDIR